MKGYEVINKLKNDEKVIFTSNDILRYSHITPKSLAKSVYRLKQQYGIYKIEKNKFSLTDDPFIVASNIVYPSYLSFTTSLYLHNALDQIINQLDIATPVRKKMIMFNSTILNFHYIKPDLMFGYRKIRRENSYIFLADIEKTIIDILYRPDICNISNIINIPAKSINKKILKEYLQRVNIEAVRRRTGYIMEYMGMPLNIKIGNKSAYKLNPYNKNLGKYIKKWNLYDNEVDY